MFVSREQLEAYEYQTLAPYALKSGDSRGRKYPDPEPDYRTAFQRDRDRVLHTTAFRRLEYKTQVFVNFEGDYYRTRLTHTLEVAQIGRTLARAFGVNEDLVEVICLAHDLGHPPFGHAGESTLNHLMSDHGGFDHNKQSLRILTKLERRYPDWSGLNLTYETREGVVKHETEYDISDVRDEYRPELRGTIEAQIANIADELAYNAHDLDDGLRSGLLLPEQMLDIEFLREVCKEIGYEGGTLSELTRHRLIRRLIGLQVNDVVTTTSRAIEDAGINTVEDVQRLPYNLVKHSEAYQQLNRIHKDFLFKNLYRHFRVVRMSRKAGRFLTELFTAYIDEPAQLPPSVREKFDARGQYRATTDYIAGMTDRFALQEWERLHVPFTRP
ncbi:MAG: deoxyguanosinetriphosphate triphosphohydrolase [Chloroflexi bacterium]|nr:deoxyguanosinetriphosphate triphosphohydrolase [Chloroflexota bacterium]